MYTTRKENLVNNIKTDFHRFDRDAIIQYLKYKECSKYKVFFYNLTTFSKLFRFLIPCRYRIKVLNRCKVYTGCPKKMYKIFIQLVREAVVAKCLILYMTQASIPDASWFASSTALRF